MNTSHDDHPVLQDIQQLLGYPLDAFLQPVNTESVTGVSLRHNDVYSAIKEARRQGDSSLPQGVWSYELKKADWQQVSSIAVEALIKKSKDLQLIIWLLEAQVHQYGFRGIAPCIQLMHSLCEKYWDAIYPQIENGDLEYRTNTISWINEKLLPVLRLIPITCAGNDTVESSWFDREMAMRNEKIKSNYKGKNEKDAEHGLEIIQRAIIATPTEFYIEVFSDLNFALQTIFDFVSFIDHCCGEQAPSLQSIINLLDDIRIFVENELTRRGVQFGTDQESDPTQTDKNAEEHGPHPLHALGTPAASLENTAAGIHAAYETLEKISAYLLQVNPHSPVPYLIRHGIQWGRMNTAELYHEIFVKCQGKINIFDILGVMQDSSTRNH